MTIHIADDIPRLLTGEATGEVVREAAGHLRVCQDCRDELVSAVIAHASLTSAHRFAPEIVRLVATPDASATQPPSALPDLEAVFAQIRLDAAVPPAHRSRRRLYAAAAVAAAVLIGGGTSAIVELAPSSNPGSRTVALEPYGVGTVDATATIARSGDLTLNAAALPRLDANHRYEVWLTNDTRTRMQPVGWIDVDGKAHLSVPTTLTQSYQDIEVSVQQVDASTYTYSGTSVLRGSYA